MFQYATETLLTATTAHEYTLAKQTAAAFTLIGTAAASAGAATVSIEFSPVDRGFLLLNKAGEEIIFEDLPVEVEGAINLALDAIDDRRPSLLAPYAESLDIDKHTGEVNTMTLSVRALTMGPPPGTETAPSATEAESAAAALDSLADSARHSAMVATQVL